MFSGNPPDARLEQLETIYNELNPLFKDYLMIQAKELLNFQKKHDDTTDKAKKPQQNKKDGDK
jgi:hypothetical protein